MDELKHLKIIDSLYMLEKKNKFLHVLVVVLIFAELVRYHLGNKLLKIYLKILVIVFFIIISPLFTTYIFLSTFQGNMISQIYDNNLDYKVVYADNLISNSDENSIEDEDIIFEDNDEYFEDIENTNGEIFTNDEIINNANISGIDEFNFLSENDAAIDLNSWELILVNKQHPFPSDYAFNLGVITGNLKCDERIIPNLVKMLSDAKEDGVDINVCSPYRDHERQIMLFNKKISTYMRAGYSYKEAYSLSSKVVTIPGSSEHELGLAFDFNTPTYKMLEAGFADTNAGKWLKSNAYKYGFILRYPSGKEDITGIEYEPWHYRYVGLSAAKYLYDNDLCLEELYE